MNLKPDKLGAEPKKIAVLVGLVLVAGYFYFSSSTPGPDSPPPKRATGAVASPAGDPEPDRTRRRSETARESLADWRPSLKRKKGFDPTRVDPRLNLALLTKLRAVPLEGGQRSLFDFSTQPIPEVKKIEIADRSPKPMPVGPPVAVPPTPPPPPQAPPIPLKFYGFVSATDSKQAFFLDGDDILVAREGDVLKKRYKIIRIGLNSAVLEDTQFKSEQTLGLVQEQKEG